jgi:hypothetical protein
MRLEYEQKSGVISVYFILAEALNPNIPYIRILKLINFYQ